MASVSLSQNGARVFVAARGGSRRERGAAIGAAVRGRGLVREVVSYSETYGFQSATYITYRER